MDNRSEIINELNISFSRPYDIYFEEKIVDRGLVYVREGKVKNIKYMNYKINSEVEGTDNYLVNIELEPEDENKIKNASCTCKYYLDNGLYCKHIYASIYSVLKDDSLLKVKDRLSKELLKTEKLLEEYKKKIKIINIKLADYDHKEYWEDYEMNNKSFISTRDLAQKESIYTSYYVVRIERLRQLQDTIEESIKELEKNSKKQIANKNEIGSRKKGNSLGLLSALGSIIGTIISSANESVKNNGRHIYTKEELDELGIYEDEERDAIKSGDYEPENFDMENMDEDNYYYDEDNF